MLLCCGVRARAVKKFFVKKMRRKSIFWNADERDLKDCIAAAYVNQNVDPSILFHLLTMMCCSISL